MTLIEVCVDSLAGAKLAQSLGADRLELCANLSIGGTTPSIGLLRLVKRSVSIPVHVLIRPRGGDFLYALDEIETMLADIASAKVEGADGIVCGNLTLAGEIDKSLTRRLIAAAAPLPFTFHRAFDHCVDPAAALSVLHDLGAVHLLTSGQAPSVVQGLPLLKKLRETPCSVSVMPGGGITPENIHSILNAIHPEEIHFSGSKRVVSGMDYPSSVPMGKEDFAESQIKTDPERLGLLILSVREWEMTQI